MKRISAAITALVLAAFSVFYLVPRLNEATGRAVAEGIRDIRTRVEGALGLSVSFDYLSPSILRAASFSQFSISAPGGRTLLRARKVRVLYDIVAILRGDRSGALNGLALEDVTLDIHLPQDKAVFDRLGTLFGAGAGGAGGTLPKIAVSGKNVSITLAVDGVGTASFDARDAGFSTFKEEPAISLDGRYSLDLAGTGLGPVSGPLSLSGSLSRNFSKARLGLSVAADAREFSISTQRFELVYGDGKLALTKVRDRAPLDADIRVDFGGGESSVTLRLDDFALSRILRLSGRFASLKPWLEVPYRGSLAVRAPGFDLARVSYDLMLSGSLPEAVLPAGGQPISAEIAAQGDARSVSIGKARLERGADSLEYSGMFSFKDLSPDGVLDLRFSLMDGVLGLASSVRLVGHNGEYAAMTDRIAVGGIVFSDVSLVAAWKGSQTDFNLSFRPPSSADERPDSPALAFSGEAGAASGMSLVRCEGSVSMGATPSFELSVDLEAIDLGPYEGLIGRLTDSTEAASIISGLKFGGALFATSDFKRLSWSAPDMTVVSRSLPGAYALLALSGTDSSLVVKHASVSVAGYSLEGTGKVDFSDASRLSFESSLVFKDIPYAIRGFIAGPRITISGDYGLELSARAEGADTYVSAKSRGLPVPLAGGLFLATVDAEGRIASTRDWDLAVAELDLVPTGEKMAGLPRVELAGNLNPFSADLSRLRVEDKYSALAGKATLDYSLSDPPAARISSRLTAAGPAKTSSPPESYSIDASYSAGKVECVVDLVASPLARFGKLPVAGSADGRVAIRGDISDPGIDFRLKLRDGRYLDQTLVLGASGRYGGKVLELRDVTSSYQAQTISAGSARFSFADASSTVSFDYSGTVIEEKVRFSLTARCSSTHAAGGTLPEMLANYVAKGTLHGLSFGSSGSANWPFDAVASPASFTVVGGNSKELRLKFGTDSSFSASLREPFPVRAEVSGLFDGKNIDMSVQGLKFDLGLLSPLMPPDLVKIVSGSARGGFRATGLANDPEISGEIDLENLTVKILGWLPEDLGPFRAPIVARGRAVSISVPSVNAGKKATVALNCQATFDHWIPSGLTASVRTIGKSRLSLDSVLLGIHAKGAASADLRFALQGDVLAINSDVVLDKGSVVVSPAILTPEAASPQRPDLFLSVAVRVRFGRGVQVFFPSSDFPVVSGFSDPSSMLSIRYDQATEDFAIKGAVALRGGEVFYIQRNFFLKTGKIVFNEGTDRFDPRVTLLAELRDRNDDGPVQILLRADNAPITSFQPRLSSNPVMTESQIAALMGQNLFATSSDNRIDLRKAVISGSEFIPQLNMTRILENRVRDTFGLDMLYLKTKVLQNWLIDISGQSASATGDTMGRYLDQTELYAGKYISDSIFAHASTRLREDPLAGANTLVIDSEIGVELDTPFGLIQWTVAPTNWDHLLISDQSISLSWKLSL